MLLLLSSLFQRENESKTYLLFVYNYNIGLHVYAETN